MHWTDNHFDEDYLLLYREQLTEERALEEVNFLKQILNNHCSKTVLDFPCGYGRHSLPLAKEGYIVHGIDTSESMIKEAMSKKGDLLNLTYEIADMRQFTRKGKFDAAICLFTSLGYYEESDNDLIVKNLCESVRDDGVIVIDIRNPIKAFQLFAKNNWHLQQDVNGVHISEELDPVSLRQTLTHQYEGKEKRAAYRHYFLPELTRMLSQQGCTVVDTYGDFLKAQYSGVSPRLIVIATKNPCALAHGFPRTAES